MEIKSKHLALIIVLLVLVKVLLSFTAIEIVWLCVDDTKPIGEVMLIALMMTLGGA